MYYALSDDIESQQKGIVLLSWIGSNKIAAPASATWWENTRLFSKLNIGAPIRVCSVHFCMPDNHIFYLIRSMQAITFFSNDKSRIKFHVGTTIRSSKWFEVV